MLCGDRDRDRRPQRVGGGRGGDALKAEYAEEGEQRRQQCAGDGSPVSVGGCGRADSLCHDLPPSSSDRDRMRYGRQRAAFKDNARGTHKVRGDRHG
ncbi:hypothetical protein GCM10010372_01640 [Streptomyces tauricus]|nr:hypothetical protein GCM10010372_01640 [Streptomyces tauricus]